MALGRRRHVPLLRRILRRDAAGEGDDGASGQPAGPASPQAPETPDAGAGDRKAVGQAQSSAPKLALAYVGRAWKVWHRGDSSDAYKPLFFFSKEDMELWRGRFQRPPPTPPTLGVENALKLLRHGLARCEHSPARVPVYSIPGLRVELKRPPKHADNRAEEAGPSAKEKDPPTMLTPVFFDRRLAELPAQIVRQTFPRLIASRRDANRRESCRQAIRRLANHTGLSDRLHPRPPPPPSSDEPGSPGVDGEEDAPLDAWDEGDPEKEFGDPPEIREFLEELGDLPPPPSISPPDARWRKDPLFLPKTFASAGSNVPISVLVLGAMAACALGRAYDRAMLRHPATWPLVLGPRGRGGGEGRHATVYQGSLAGVFSQIEEGGGWTDAQPVITEPPPPQHLLISTSKGLYLGREHSRNVGTLSFDVNEFLHQWKEGREEGRKEGGRRKGGEKLRKGGLPGKHGGFLFVGDQSIFEHDESSFTSTIVYKNVRSTIVSTNV